MIPSQGTKIPHAAGQLSPCTTSREKPTYCNKEPKTANQSINQYTLVTKSQRFGSEPEWPREMCPRPKLSLTQENLDSNPNANLAPKNQETLVMMSTHHMLRTSPRDSCFNYPHFTHEEI